MPGANPFRVEAERRAADNPFRAHRMAQAAPDIPEPIQPSDVMPLTPVDRGIAAAGDFANRAFVEPGNQFWQGAKGASSRAYQIGANVSNLVGDALNTFNTQFDQSADAMGTPEAVRGPTFDSPIAGAAKSAGGYLAGASGRVAPQPSDMGSDTISKIYQGFGAATVDIPLYALGVRALGPTLGFGAVDALADLDKGPAKAVESGVKGLLLGKMLEGAGPLTRPAKVAALGTVGGTMAAAEGGDVSDIVAGGTVLGALGAMHGGRVTGREAARDAAGELMRPVDAVRRLGDGRRAERSDRELNADFERMAATSDAEAALRPERGEALAPERPDTMQDIRARMLLGEDARATMPMSLDGTIGGALRPTMTAEPRVTLPEPPRPPAPERVGATGTAEGVLQRTMTAEPTVTLPPDARKHPSAPKIEAPAAEPKAVVPEAPKLETRATEPEKPPRVLEQSITDPVEKQTYKIEEREDRKATVQFTGVDGTPNKRTFGSIDDARAWVTGIVSERANNLHHFIKSDLVAAEEATKDAAGFRRTLERANKNSGSYKALVNRATQKDRVSETRLALAREKVQLAERLHKSGVMSDQAFAEIEALRRDTRLQAGEPKPEAPAAALPDAAVPKKPAAKRKKPPPDQGPPPEITVTAGPSGVTLERAKHVKPSADTERRLPKRAASAPDSAALERAMDAAAETHATPRFSPELKAAIKNVRGDVEKRLMELEEWAKAHPYGQALAEARRTADELIYHGSKKDIPLERKTRIRGFLDGVTSDRFELLRNDNSYTAGVARGERWRGDRPPIPPASAEFILKTPTGGETKYRLPADPDAIKAFRDRLLKQPDRMFSSKAPGTQASAATAVHGVNYEGMIKSKPDNLSTAPKAKPIRREDILGDLAKGLGAAVYEGRVKGKRLGFYRTGIEEVRIKNKADIETAAHEVAHMLDDRLPAISKAYNNPRYRDEVRGVSYDRGKTNEGFAEFVRHWMTNEPAARLKAPDFVEWWEGFVDALPKKEQKAIRTAQRDMHRWFEQDELTKVQSKIGDSKREINAHLDTAFDRFRQSVSDDLHGVMRYEEVVGGGLAPRGAYEVSRMARAAYSIFEGALTIGAPKIMPDGSHRYVGKGLEQVLEPVSKSLDDFLLYAIGRSARELLGQGRENLFTRSEIASMLRLGQGRPEFAKAFDEYQVWNKAILDFAQAKGAISADQRAKWRRQEYLPFHRVSHGMPSSGSSKGTPGEWGGIKALRGGTGNLRPMLGNMIQNAHMLIDVALKNEARLAVADLSQQPGGARFMAKIPKDIAKLSVERDQYVAKALEDMGIDRANVKAVKEGDFSSVDPAMEPAVRAILDADTNSPFVNFWRFGVAPKGGNVVAVLRNGKPEYYEVADPILYRSLARLNRPTQNWVIRMLGIPKRVGQAGITLSVDFMAGNLQRDTIAAFIFSRAGYKPFIDAVIGLKHSFTRDQVYKDWKANGGDLASIYGDEAAVRDKIQGFYQSRGINPRSIFRSPIKLIEKMEALSQRFESATRLSEYRRAIARGEHPRHAAYLSREVSTDFAMRGDNAVLEGFYDTVMFLKAGINGLDRGYRGFVTDPHRGMVAAKTAMLAAASAALYAYNRDQPEYEALEDWDKNLHWHFFVPAADGGKHHFRMLKIWEVGAIATMAERALEGVLKEQPVEAGKQIAKAFLGIFNLDYAPQAVAPLYEVYALNRNRFTDRPIETMSMEGKEPWARYGPYTSQAAKAAGEATRGLPRELQISPARADALVRGYLTTWGGYGLSIADGLMMDSNPDARADEYPVVKRFYRKIAPEALSARRTKYSTELYDAIREAVETRRTMTQMKDEGRADIAKELAYKPENKAYGMAMAAQKGLRGFQASREFVHGTKDLDGLQNMARYRDELRGTDVMARAVRAGAWYDIGRLKRMMLDDISAEQEQFAKQAKERMDAVDR